MPYLAVVTSTCTAPEESFQKLLFFLHPFLRFNKQTCRERERELECVCVKQSTIKSKCHTHSQLFLAELLLIQLALLLNSWHYAVSGHFGDFPQ